MVPSLKKKVHEKGLTLIEVLIALAIIGIALTAIIKATSENIQATAYLQDKTFAMWVAKEVINQARVELIELPYEPDHLKGKTTLLNHKWYWQGSQIKTPNKHISKLLVQVYERPIDDGNSPLATMESYLLHDES